MNNTQHIPTGCVTGHCNHVEHNYNGVILCLLIAAVFLVKLSHRYKLVNIAGIFKFSR